MAEPRSPQHVALGRAVRQLRVEGGLSQDEFGYRSSLHRNYVGRIERGEINASYAVLLKLAEGLGVRVSELIALAERLS